VITVIPAFQFLWSERDVRLGHYRRYKVNDIKTLATNAGFQVLKCSYINLFYFPLLLSIVRFKRLFSKTAMIKTDVATVPKPLNRFFTWVLDLETLLLKNMDFPLGCSTVFVGRK